MQDVIAVSLRTWIVRIIAANQTEAIANAIVKTAVLRPNGEENIILGRTCRQMEGW